MTDESEQLKMLNRSNFKPDSLAILEEKIGTSVTFPDSSNIQLTSFAPEELSLDVYTNKQGLLVLSEMYYPLGWSAWLNDDEELKIYRTNHLLRSVIVPAGKHTVTFRFHPATYYAGVNISVASMIFMYILIVIFVLKEYGPAIQRLTGRSEKQS